MSFSDVTISWLQMIEPFLLYFLSFLELDSLNHHPVLLYLKSRPKIYFCVHWNKKKKIMWLKKNQRKIKTLTIIPNLLDHCVHLQNTN